MQHYILLYLRSDVMSSDLVRGAARVLSDITQHRLPGLSSTERLALDAITLSVVGQKSLNMLG